MMPASENATTLLSGCYGPRADLAEAVQTAQDRLSSRVGHIGFARASALIGSEV
jgi:hypothetical protein